MPTPLAARYLDGHSNGPMKKSGKPANLWVPIMLSPHATSEYSWTSPPSRSRRRTWEVVNAFFAAAGQGDITGLLAVLAPEVELRARGPKGTVVIRGAGEVAAQATMAAGPRPGARAHPALIDGDPGILVTVTGRPVTTMDFTITGGTITAIRALTDPDRLAQVIPSWVA